MKKIKEKSYKKYKYLILVAGILTLFPIFSISSDINMSKNLLKFSLFLKAIGFLIYLIVVDKNSSKFILILATIFVLVVKVLAEYDYILYGGSNVILSGLPLEFFTILYYAAAISILTQFSENYKTK